ncbi:PAS domain S-box protein [Halobaculum sp. CBA1158]|uniref:histidine kinase N-terminal 7TM domain-containing protein n=1 Tax=Halobaculum sp. CBA1158 TaxID=2904243 RepID=UPI001F21B806|nr:histidine kinase N-terminal 7TM domain-containing protein [Halobaculum sp. CBA1158]UIO99283.1 PAS domain S-box protein [Halobaculum sp. CBA1158]
MDHISDIVVGVTFAAALASTATGTVAYLRTRERADHAGTAFVAVMYGAALWAALLGAQLLAGTTPLGRALFRLKWAAGAPVVTTALLFALYYTGRGGWVTRRRAALLAVEPAAAAALFVLDPGGVMFSSVAERTVYGMAMLVESPGVGFLVHFGYCLLIGTAFVMLLAEAAFTSSGPYRLQAMTLAAGATIPLSTELAFILDPPGVPPFDMTPIAFGAVAVLQLIAMYRFALFDVAPVAHETVFGGLDDAIVVVDESDRVLETNPAAREAFDLAGDGVGRDARAVLPDDPGTEDLLDGDDAEVTLDDGDGELVVAGDRDPTYFEATCEPLGREGVRLLVFRDVTERTRVERRYRAYVEHADDIVAVADADGVLHYVSPAVEGVLGYDADDIEGEVLTEYIHPDDRRSVAEPFVASLENPGGTVRMTFRVRHANGGWRTLDGVAVNRFHDPHVGGYLMTLRDETRRDRYEQRLRVLTRVLRHDLRNELNVVLGYADVIGAEADDRTGEHVESIRRAAERLASLGERVRGVDQTLRSADHGGRPVSVTAVVERVAERARDRFPDAEVRVDGDDGDDGDAIAYADELLATAAWNAVENAVRHHDGDRPRVLLSTRRDGDAVELRIADNGSGIPDEDREAVESGHETQLQHASGIGLWLVRWIVDGVDGELAFAIDDPDPDPFDDTGTVVVLRFRAVEDGREPDPAAEQIDPWGVASAGAGHADGGDDGWHPPTESQRDGPTGDVREAPMRNGEPTGTRDD